MKGPGVLVQFLARTAAPTFSYLASLSHVSELSLQTRSYFMDSGGDDNLLATSSLSKGANKNTFPEQQGSRACCPGPPAEVDLADQNVTVFGIRGRALIL